MLSPVAIYESVLETDCVLGCNLGLLISYQSIKIGSVGYVRGRIVLMIFPGSVSCMITMIWVSFQDM